MYKDVWRKFGVKVLIILCSVLLLGGVAVAAPRLRADNKISLADAVSNNELSVRSVRYELDESRFNENGEALYADVGIVAIPQAFVYKAGTSDEKQIPIGTIQVDLISNEDTYRTLGQKTVKLSVTGGGSDIFEDTSEDGVRFSYTVERGQYENLSNISYTPASYEVKETGYPTLNQSHLTVNVTYKGKTYTLPKNDIYFSTSDKPITGAGTYQHEISFVNFTSTNQDNNDTEGRATEPMSLAISKDVQYLTAEYDGKVLNADFSIERNTTMDTSKLKIYDNGVQIYGSGYTGSQKVRVSFVTTGVTKPYLRISGVSGTGYINSYDLEFSFSQSDEYFVLPDSSIFPRVIDYDDYNGYINKPRQLASSKGGTTYTINNDYTVSDDSFVFI